MCSRVNLLACCNSYKLFFLLFFIIYSQSFLILRASYLLRPHLWSLTQLTMENMCLSTTFTQWEGSTSNDGTGISSSSFPFDDLRTLPRAPIDGCLSAANIVLSLLLKMTSMIKQQCQYACSTIFRIAPSSILLELHSKFFRH